MPYKNIVFVKLLVELLNDNRWTHNCNINQRLLYIGLLLLAGITNNKIPNDPRWIKWRLNLDLPTETIEQDIIHIATIFDKVLKNEEFISFSNFDKIHSFVSREKIGTPITAIDKIRVREDKSKRREEKKGVYAPNPKEKKKISKKIHKDTKELIEKLSKDKSVGKV